MQKMPLQIPVTKKLRKKKNLIGIPFYLVLTFLILIPMFLLFLHSIQKSDASNDFQFTLEHYLNFFKESAFIKAMIKSLLVALATTIVTLLIGYPLAYYIAQSKKQTQVLLITLVTAPMWINMLLRVKAIQQILQMIHIRLPNSNVSLIIGLVYVFLPFMVLPIYTLLSKLDDSLLESSADLGASKRQTFMKVVLPLSLPGVISGIIMVFLPAATTLVVPNYLGDGTNMIGNIIESAIRLKLYGGYGYGAAIALVLALIILSMVMLLRRVEMSKGGGKHA